MTIKINGVLYDGSSSKARASVLTLYDDGSLVLQVDGIETSINIDSISSRLGDSARYIQITELGKFESRQNDEIDTLANRLNPKGRSNVIHKLESNMPLICMGIIITIAFVAATFKWGIPTLADHIVDRLPEKTTDYIEDAMISRLEEKWFKPSKLSTERQIQLQRLFDSVKSDLGMADKDYQFKLYDAEESVGANALAFPSGMIVMTDQMVNKVSSDTQIAGVIAHELGHLDGKHSLRQVFRGSILTVAIAWITGDISGASTTIITAPAVLMQLRYSREFETEADRYAVRYIGCNKNALEEMSDFFKLIEHLNDDNHVASETQSPLERGGLDFFSTHPASHKRSDYFAQYYSKNCL